MISANCKCLTPSLPSSFFSSWIFKLQMKIPIFYANLIFLWQWYSNIGEINHHYFRERSKISCIHEFLNVKALYVGCWSHKSIRPCLLSADCSIIISKICSLVRLCAVGVAYENRDIISLTMHTPLVKQLNLNSCSIVTVNGTENYANQNVADE